MRWKTDESTLARSNIEHYRPMMNWKSLWSSSRPLHVRRQRRCDAWFLKHLQRRYMGFCWTLCSTSMCSTPGRSQVLESTETRCWSTDVCQSDQAQNRSSQTGTQRERMSSLMSDRSCLFLATNQTCSSGLGSLWSTDHVSTAFTSHRFRSTEKVSRAECGRSLSSPTVAVLSRNTRSTAAEVS